VSAWQQPAIGACMQPTPGSQLSVVQGLASSQSGGVPATQVLFTHVSAPLHTSPSSQSPSFTQQPGIGALTQPDAGSQESAVHTAPSSQLVEVCVQPEEGSHASSVQGSPSLQLRAVPAWHWFVCLLQVSNPSQGLPLSQSVSA